MSLSEAAVFLMGLGQQVWQQQRDEGPALCLAGLAPFLVAATVAGLHTIRSRLRRSLS